MKTNLSGRNALITGSTSGIGLGLAISLAEQGANIVLNGFGDHLPAQHQIEALGVKVAYHAADMTQPDQIKDMVHFAQKTMGSLDILVNNAGIQHVANIEDFPAQKWDSIIAINLSSSYHTSHHAMPAMKAANWGRIINISSVHGLVASPQKVAYVSAKHGLIGLTKVVALETAQTGVTCNAICPGWVLTPLVQAQVDAKAKELGVSVEKATELLLGEKMPSMQFTTPAELGDLAVFLCSDTGHNIRGVAWNMDGGWAAQ